MTEQIYSENTRKIIKNKKVIEETLNVKLSKKENIIFIEGDAENEYICLQAIEAINLGFSIKVALLLKDEEIVFGSRGLNKDPADFKNSKFGKIFHIFFGVFN